jgi:ACT domain-containing protein
MKVSAPISQFAARTIAVFHMRNVEDGDRRFFMLAFVSNSQLAAE